ncbi:MAG: hypothetical protein HQM07_09585 [Zetaproteobacteria bacterium]|nr:hypothetical protein [Zetaproteobacteria bacterium]
MKKVPKEWLTYKYLDPKKVLPELHKIRVNLSISDTPHKIRNLRTNKLKSAHEGWDTAFFCYLISQVIGTNVFFSRVEKSDYDSIFKWVDGDIEHFAPVQMKELVPKGTNPEANLGSIVSKLKKYVSSPELIVGIKLNRRETIDFSKIDFKSSPVGEIWCFGATMLDETTWGIWGDFLAEPRQYEFEVPFA